ncbi:MAG: SDR family NAD(P)-dependent oxidoreductase [Anaerolineae bacterium]|nr:SDR family NAD(P)-dependent oxidoreductase [Anaerolineae bacterium]
MTLEGARVLVTGASGFIGARLVARLVEQGARVVCQARPGDCTGHLPVDPEDCHAVDLRAADAVRRLVEDAAPEVVFHLAAAGVTDPFLPLEDALQVNLYGALRLAQALRGRARIIMARTAGEKDNLNPYAASKHAAWSVMSMLHHTEGWPLVGLMLFQVYGPGQAARALVPSAIRAALAGADFPTTHGAQVRDWVYVDDVVRAFLAAARAPDADGHTVEIGAGQGHRLRDVVDLIWRLAGARGAVRAGALPARPGEPAQQIADPKPAARLLSWRAETPLEAGLAQTIAAAQRG